MLAFMQSGHTTAAAAMLPAAHKKVMMIHGRRLLSTSAALPGQLGKLPGYLYSWGKGDNGELGLGPDFPPKPLSLVVGSRSTSKPRPVMTPSSTRFLAIAAGTTHSAAISNDHKLYTWGLDKQGVLGRGGGKKDEPCWVPTEVAMPPPTEKGDKSVLAQVSCGEAHTATLSSQGEVHTMGWGGSASYGCGALGNGTLKSHFTPTRIWVGGPEFDIRLKQISSGAYHMLGLGFDGEVWVWGNGPGLLGNGKNGDALEPMPVSDLLDLDLSAVDVACGSNFNAIVTKDGEVYTWGRNDYGQLGLGGGFNLDIEKSPRLVEGLLGHKVVNVAAGRTHAACVTDKGEVFFWGYGAWMQPHLVTVLQGRRVCAVACGHNYTAAITAEGDLFTWSKLNAAFGSSGVLGLGHFKAVSQPELVTGFTSPVLHVACGDQHVLALAVEPGVPAGTHKAALAAAAVG
jgi:alpha-tubulin suppressor-like RCC1 family protein